MHANRNAGGDGDAVSTVTLNRAHRDALRSYVELALDDDSLRYYVERIEKEQARAHVGRLDTCLRVLDQLGWIEQDDRESYQLKLDAEMIALLEYVGERARGTLEDERKRGQLSPDPDWSEETVEYFAESRRRIIDTDLDTIDAVRLAQTAAGAGAERRVGA